MDLQYTVALNLNYVIICNGMITSFLIHPRFKLGGVRDFVSQVLWLECNYPEGTRSPSSSPRFIVSLPTAERCSSSIEKGFFAIFDALLSRDSL